MSHTPFFYIICPSPVTKPQEEKKINPNFTSEVQSHSGLIFPGTSHSPADCERWCTRTLLTGSHKPTCLSHLGLIQFHYHSRGNRVPRYLPLQLQRRRKKVGQQGGAANCGQTIHPNRTRLLMCRASGLDLFYASCSVDRKICFLYSKCGILN